LVVYSRDEGKQAAMARTFPEGGPDGLRYMLGDVCDTERLTMAMRGITHVIHAAAMKMIDKCEWDAFEATRINVMGTLSVVKACMRTGVHRAIYISTDKAPNSCGVYGATKRLGEEIWTHANTYGPTEFDCVRYGNVRGSNKSVFQTWKALAATGKTIELTSGTATRFFWDVKDAASFCLRALECDTRGMIYIPKMQSYKMADMARQFTDKIIITGYRCPEKDHEILWTDWEHQWVRDLGWAYCLYPMIHPWTINMDMRGQPVQQQVTSENSLARA